MNKLFSNPLFPAGLSVLVVDDDATCLRILEALLRACHYKVVKCERAIEALRILQEGKDEIDIVLSELHMSGMNGFQLLHEIIRLQIDLPVVMMSSDERVDVIKKVVIQGACGYLLKPVRKEEIKLIWQHVIRHKQGSSGEMPQQKIVNAENCGSSNNNGEKKLQDAREAKAKQNDSSATANVKKLRMVWTPQLHQQFVAVVNQIGLKNAVPKKILDLMNVPHLTRENVASHLQKYRIHLQRNEDQNSQKKLSIHYEDINNIEAAYAAVLNEQPVMNAAVLSGDYNYVYNNLYGGRDYFRPHDHSGCTSSSASSMVRQFEQQHHDPPNSQYNGDGDLGASFYVPSGTDSN